MPVLVKGDLVLVTGANSFIASSTIQTLLNNEFRVRGTVRSREKGEYLQQLYDSDNFEYIIVEDIADDGSFEQAVLDVDAVVHSAFVGTGFEDPEESGRLSVKALQGLLDSIKQIKVKRVILVSSCAAVITASEESKGCRYTEKDWNDLAVKLVEEKGWDAPPGSVYMAAKTLTERAFWSHIEDQQPEWEGVALCPTRVYGDFIHELSSPEDLNSWASHVYKWATGRKSEEDLRTIKVDGFVHIEDVIQAHLRALTLPEAAGQRFIVCNDLCSEQDYCDVLRKHFSDLPNVPTGAGIDHSKAYKDALICVGAKAEEVLGITYTPLEKTLVVTIACLRERLKF